MRFFDFFLQLNATRAWSLRAFLSASLSSFYPPPRPILHSSSMPTMTPASSTYSPPMPSKTLPQMPLELVLSFIETACAEADGDTHVQLLMACSLVCKAWSTAAQRLLFSRVTLRSQSSFQLFMNAVDRTTQHGHTLGASIKRMRVVLDHNQPSSLHHHSFALAVTVCPNLRELDIALYGCAEPGKDIVGVPDISRLRRSAPSFDEQTISLLKSGPEIKVLHFDNWSENQQSIFQLLDVWPSLQYLSIGGTTPQHLQHSPPPFPCALRGICFNFQTTPSIDFLKWLLHKSAGSLRFLHFERDPSIDSFDYLINAYGSKVQSVCLPGFGSPEYASLIQKCDHLRELRTENPACSQAFYKRLPKDLEHIAFGLDRDTPLNSIVELVKTRDALKTVKVQLWEGGLNHPLLSPLKMICAYRGTHLMITNNLRQFRTTNMT